MKILVISDLHVGTTARAKDFCTLNSDSASAITENFIDDFKELVQSENLSATHLLIAGDITDRGEISEFEMAAERIQDIINILNIDIKNVFFVPGNHDGNWVHERESSSRGDKLEKVRSAKYINIKSNDFFSSILDNSVFSSYYKDPFSAIWESDEIVVVGVNSSAYDSCDKEIKFGEVDLKCLSTLQQKLLEMKEKKDRRLKILLTHHHPKIYTDRTFPDADLSQMKNAEDFLHFASMNEFNFIVHGHKHIPRFNFQIDADGYAVNILSAGSFSAQLKDWHNGVANFIHLIEHHDFCPENNYSRGRVISWSYFTNHKWKRSLYDRDRISHEEYFGSVLSKSKLKRILKKEISEWKTIKNM
ncbi:conserved hypothetical protein [Enterobacterales bacterium 8AC]|nr:conserved hypothetical protein [Enterobacterales bacterium 8AC]